VVVTAKRKSSKGSSDDAGRRLLRRRRRGDGSGGWLWSVLCCATGFVVPVTSLLPVVKDQGVWADELVLDTCGSTQIVVATAGGWVANLGVGLGLVAGVRAGMGYQRLRPL